MTDKNVPLIIVGGSLVGLSTSLFLSWHGVPHLLVERHPGTAIHPRAASFHQRTMEMFRSVGLQDEVEKAAEKEFVQNGAILTVDSLAGKELAHFYRSFNEGVENLSPTSRIFITQVGLEPVIRDRAQELGGEHSYGTELVSFEQDDDGVTAVVRPRDGGPDQVVRAQYMVAADGAHSRVRESLGIEMEGRGAFADCVTIYFKADVRSLIGERNLSVVYVDQPGLLAFFRFSIGGDGGFLAIFRADAEESVGKMSEERAADYVRQALGSASDLPVEVDNIQRWSASAAWASRFSQDRVFLAGDAAHVMPPTGGFGGNAGVADAYNLAWKIAAVVQGAAGPELLESYATERQPVCASTVEQAYTRYVTRVDSSLSQENVAEPLDDASIELGTIYRSSAVLAEPADGEHELELEDPRAPSGKPGTRLPHVPLERGGKPISSLDLVGSGYTLLTGAKGEPWHAAAGEVATSLGVPVRSVAVHANGTVIDSEGRLGKVLGVSEEGVVLIRPDGVIAWRSIDAGADPRVVLEDVLRWLTFRPESASSGAVDEPALANSDYM